tara:strand:+ start:426 stop:1547 length:1122 start_codon:yes stop_codon:yes gene_type:complete
MNVKKTVFVVNLSKDKKGSLNTFFQALDAIQLKEKDYECYVFCRLEEILKYQSKNIHVVLLELNKFKRFFFESKFLRIWSKKNNIYADLVISLQNTSIKYFKNIPQIILLQQSIPLSNTKWNLLKKAHLRMWFYKHIYPFFIRRYINNQTTIIVPTKWMRNTIIKKWGMKKDQVKVVYSQFRSINQDDFTDIGLDNSKFHIFYPSNSAPHKNHTMLILAFVELKKKYPLVFKNIILYLTLNKNDSFEIESLVDKHKFDNNILFEGEMDYSRVLSFYKFSNLLAWPSFIESFGLPLLEAARFGIPIIASDLPYAREVISGYKGVKYVNHKNPTEWADAIVDAYSKKSKHQEYIPVFDSDWSDFIKIINQKLNYK